MSGFPLGEPDWWSTSTVPDRTIGGLDAPHAVTDDLGVIRNAVIHILNEQPLIADLFESPSPGDVGMRCTNLRTLDGKRPIFVDDSASIFFFPYLHIRFVEIPPGAVSGSDPTMALDLAAAVAAETAPPPEPEPEPELEIDEDFLRRIREV